MCERIARREFDWTRDTVQPLLKLFRGVGLGRAPYHRADRIIASPPPQRAGQPFLQDAEKVRQRRSRIVQTLNGDPAASPLGGAHRLGAPYSSHRAPQRVRLGPSLAAALLGELFEHPAAPHPVVPDVQAIEVLLADTIFCSRRVLSIC